MTNQLCDPECPICAGVGFVRYNVPMADERFGKMQICPKRVKHLQRTLGAGGLYPDEVQELSWNMVQEGINEGHVAKAAVEQIYQQGYGIAFLYGGFGQAKTLLLKIGVAVALREGRTAAYANMGDILEDLKQSFDEQNSSRELSRRMHKWLSMDLLSIDELDKVNQTEWARSVIHKLLDHRYTRAVREEAITLVAANLGGGIDSLDGYLASRLRDNRVGRLVELDGPDGRRVMPKGYRY